MKSLRTKSHTFANRTNQRLDQSLQKSVHFSHPENNFKFFSHAKRKKLKHANTQATQTEKKNETDMTSLL